MTLTKESMLRVRSIPATMLNGVNVPAATSMVMSVLMW